METNSFHGKKRKIITENKSFFLSIFYFYFIHFCVSCDMSFNLFLFVRHLLYVTYSIIPIPISKKIILMSSDLLFIAANYFLSFRYFVWFFDFFSLHFWLFHFCFLIFLYRIDAHVQSLIAVNLYFSCNIKTILTKFFYYF